MNKNTALDIVNGEWLIAVTREHPRQEIMIPVSALIGVPAGEPGELSIAVRLDKPAADGTPATQVSSVPDAPVVPPAPIEVPHAAPTPVDDQADDSAADDLPRFLRHMADDDQSAPQSVEQLPPVEPVAVPVAVPDTAAMMAAIDEALRKTNPHADVERLEQQIADERKAAGEQARQMHHALANSAARLDASETIVRQQRQSLDAAMTAIQRLTERVTVLEDRPTPVVTASTGDQIIYELALKAMNGNVQAMQLLQPAAEARGTTVQLLAASIEADRRDQEKQWALRLLRQEGTGDTADGK